MTRRNKETVSLTENFVKYWKVTQISQLKVSNAVNLFTLIVIRIKSPNDSNPIVKRVRSKFKMILS